MSEEKEKESNYQIQIGKLNKEQLRELLGVIQFFSAYGLHHFQYANWEELKREMPVLEKMSPDHATHYRMGEVCHILFSDWFKEIVKEGDANWDGETIHAEDFYLLGKGKDLPTENTD